MFSPYLGKEYTNQEIENALYQCSGKLQVVHS